jgi:hypothetical protein
MSDAITLSADPASPTNDKTLNVFLHGLFCIIDHPYGLDVLLPHLPEHSYRAGSFLGETIIIQRPYHQPYVLHVPGGSKRFDPAKNLSVRNLLPNDSAGPSELQARITMPLPYDIFYVQPSPLGATLIDNQGFFQSRTACMLLVLQYKFSNVRQIKLEGHPYVATLDPPKDGTTSSLHIFSEEDFLPDAGHRINGFGAAANLLPSLRGNVSLADITPKPPDLLSSEIIPGTIAPEYANLQTRTQGALARLGSTMRSRDWPSLSTTTGAGADVHTCTAITSCCDGVTA